MVRNLAFAIILLASAYCDSANSVARCKNSEQPKDVKLVLVDVRKLQLGTHEVQEAEFELTNSGDAKILFYVTAVDAKLSAYPLSFGYQIEVVDGQWSDSAVNLDAMRAPDTSLELAKGGRVRFIQDTSDAYGPQSEGNAKRAWIKDERTGCRIYSSSFMLPKP